eukprot:scaffold97040_cov13-Tisochrysis_lutea.AAC.1
MAAAGVAEREWGVLVLVKWPGQLVTEPRAPSALAAGSQLELAQCNDAAAADGPGVDVAAGDFLSRHCGRRKKQET